MLRSVTPMPAWPSRIASPTRSAAEGRPPQKGENCWPPRVRHKGGHATRPRVQIIAIYIHTIESVGTTDVETNSRKLMRMLVRDGWMPGAREGRPFTPSRHPRRAELISLTHPRKDLPVGQVRSIYRIAGWKP